MCAQAAAALLGLRPRLSVREVQVAVPLKLSPAFFTLLLICSRNSTEATRFNVRAAQLPPPPPVRSGKGDGGQLFTLPGRNVPGLGSAGLGDTEVQLSFWNQGVVVKPVLTVIREVREA